ncbi:MAG: helix-turn-helix domain-containing protein [Leptolyngbyaceae cyanobacterium]
MHPEDIKAALRKRGTKLSCLARELDVTPTMITLVIRSERRSRRIEKEIARKLGLSLCEVFPTFYSPVCKAVAS